MSSILCPRCNLRTKVPGDGYCKPCRSEYSKDYYRQKQSSGGLKGSAAQLERVTRPLRDGEGKVSQCIVCLGDHRGRNTPDWRVYVCDRCIGTAEVLRSWGTETVGRLLEYLSYGNAITRYPTTPLGALLDLSSPTPGKAFDLEELIGQVGTEPKDSSENPLQT
jgi:hypothetical protein